MFPHNFTYPEKLNCFKCNDETIILKQNKESI